ncbi:hypothetical protein BJ741DRAFT_368577 [Chytriomyces cf. hyalinus JEL632]|nr:hypothetical protein BJ741DRAFT_368577 [Chytriomyces cf. hyalinus JEL632]
MPLLWLLQVANFCFFDPSHPTWSFQYTDMNKTRKQESRTQAAHTAADHPIEAPHEAMTRGETSSVGLNATNSDLALKESTAKSLKKTRKAHSSETVVHEQLQVVEKIQDEKVVTGKVAKKSAKSKKEVENNNNGQGNAPDTALETKPQVLQEFVAEPVVPKMARTDAPEVITLATPEPLLRIVSQGNFLDYLIVFNLDV